MARQIALLRGINLGSQRRLAMGDLRELLASLGYEDVRTYLQSGNVVLTSDHPSRQVERELERQIAEQLGVDPLVLVRTRDELAAVVAGDPLGGLVDRPKLYQVTFLSTELAPARAREIGELAVAPEQLVVRGRELYAWHPAGIQGSRLAAALTDRRLGVTATARNWNTVTKLLALADA